MAETFEQWLREIGLGEYAQVLQDNGVDFRSLSLISEADLAQLGITLGHRRLLLAELAKREKSMEEAAAESSTKSSVSNAERRQVSVLFCDIVDATHLSTIIDPEDLSHVLLKYQNCVVDCVTSYGGYVAKFLGDGVLAYFGWPQAYEDQAERAIRAAQDSIQAVGNIHVDDTISLQARAGIATGEVVVGDLIGAKTTDQHAAIGETPNLAARLQASAQPGQVMVDPNTQKLAGATFAMEDCGLHPIKGFDENINLWKVSGEGDPLDRFRAIHGDVSPDLKGRDKEIEQLNSIWTDVVAGSGKVVIVEGEAGIGKSAITAHFAQSVSGVSSGDWRFQCSEFHSNHSLYPIKRQFIRKSGISDADDTELKLAKLERFWLAFSGNQDDLLHVAELVGIETDAASGNALTPQQKRDRIIQALLQQVGAASSKSPVLLILEDMHWIDPSTGALLKQVADLVANLPVMILITTRPVEAATFVDQEQVTNIMLGELDGDASKSIVEAVSNLELAPHFISEIVERANGNPLFLEELTKSVVEQEPDGTQEAELGGVPLTLQSSLIARLDQLNTAKEIAQIGAVAGMVFSEDMIRQLTAKPSEEINRSLEQLVQSGLVQERVGAGERNFVFKHALIHDAAYGTILKNNRKKLHRKIIKIMESQLDDSKDGDRLFGQIALHAMRGEQWEIAREYSHRAAQQSQSQSALQEAIALYNHSLKALDMLPKDENNTLLAIDIRLELRNALWASGNNHEIFRQLTIAEELAKSLNDEKRLGWIWVYRGASLWLIGRNLEARQDTKQALDMAEKVDDVSLRTAAGFYLGCALVQNGDYRIAVERFQRLANLLEDYEVTEFLGMPFAPTVVVRSWLIWSLAELGRFREALAAAKEGLATAEEIKHPFSHVHVLYDIGYLHLIREDFDEAHRVLTEAYDLARHWKLGNLELFVSGFLGYAKLMRDDVEGALEQLTDCVAAYERQGSGLFHSLAVIYLAEAQLMAGRKDEALMLAKEAVTLTQQRGERGHEAYAKRMLGIVLAKPPNEDRAAAQVALLDAQGIATARDMQPLAELCVYDMDEAGLSRV